MKHTIKVAKIEHGSQVDGPGKRTVIFLQGCPIHCPGCQNQHLWDPEGGKEMDIGDVLMLALEHDEPLTISGGEPFAQAEALSSLLINYRIHAPQHPDIIVYTGYTWEQLTTWARSGALPITDVLLQTSVLIDGPYMQALDHNRMQWRGSPNQRVIDVYDSMGIDLTLPGRVFYLDHPVLLDWDAPTIVVTDEGDLLAAEGLMQEFFGGDELEPTRMCGQTQSPALGQTK